MYNSRIQYAIDNFIDERDKGIINIRIDETIELPHRAIKMVRDVENDLQGIWQI